MWSINKWIALSAAASLHVKHQRITSNIRLFYSHNNRGFKHIDSSKGTGFSPDQQKPEREKVI